MKQILLKLAENEKIISVSLTNGSVLTLDTRKPIVDHDGLITASVVGEHAAGGFLPNTTAYFLEKDIVLVQTVNQNVF
ncbi:hypothetical protein [Secundilactobacillus similis]|uniref:hypothetical protein n=1 Tax=Secundilactobacillus similis TaxID=414682 RepID=UPI0006CF5FC8|nr:hypothetical protein [Secundilactobacillus similis]